MSTEENKALVRRSYEVFNQGNVTAFFELFTPDHVFHQASMTVRGLEALKQLHEMYMTAFPDFHFTAEDMLAEGDTVAVRNTASGTHLGAFMGTPPTGKHWTVSEIAFFRVVGGKIAEHWSEPDMLGLLQQLGVVPMPGIPEPAAGHAANLNKGASHQSTEENKALLCRTYEALNQKNLDAFFELFAPDFVLRNGSMTIQGLEAFKPLMALHLTALPDIHYTVEDIIAEGDTVAVRLAVPGTHRGELMGIPPTGKYTTVTESAISHIVGGKIAEHWSETDMFGLMQQLGVIPMQGQPVE